MSPQELELLGAVDADSMAALYRECQPMLEQRLGRLNVEPDDRDDAIQLTWLRVLERHTQFQNRGSFYGWLWRICRNAALEQRRNVRRRRHREEASGRIEDAMVPLVLGTPTRRSLKSIKRLLSDCIREFPRREREIVTMCWLAGHSVADAAHQLNIAPGTVKATLHHARQRIRSISRPQDWRVTGAAALVKAYNPSWTNVQVRSRLTSTAIDLGAPGRDSNYGYGLVNLSAAIP